MKILAKYTIPLSLEQVESLTKSIEGVNGTFGVFGEPKIKEGIMKCFVIDDEFSQVVKTITDLCKRIDSHENTDKPKLP